MSYVGHSLLTNMHRVSRSDVASAKRLMAEVLSLVQTAKALDVLTSDLDRALWEHLGTSPDVLAAPVRRLHKADF